MLSAFSPPCRGGFGSRLFFLTAGDARAQGVHEIDDARRGDVERALLGLDAGPLLPEQLDDRIFIMVDECARVEIGLLRFQNVLGELKHVGRELDVGDILEILGAVAHLIGIAQQVRLLDHLVGAGEHRRRQLKNSY